MLIGRRVLLSWELVEVASAAVIAADQLQTTVDAVLAPHGRALDAMAADVAAAIEVEQVRRSDHLPLPNLDSFAMQAGAIACMHRASRESFERGREMLEALIERHPRQAAPRAWLAKWHVLRFTRGLVHDLPAHAQQALALTTQAIELDPEDAFALAVEGFVRVHMLKDFDGARDCYARALEHNANEPLAWLFSSVLHAFEGAGALAVESASHALTLSPLDPMRYFFDSLAATAELSAGRYEQALTRARQSYRRNRMHSSTLRVMAIAQVRMGQMEGARQAMAALRVLEPELTAARYLVRFPAGARETARAWAEALCEAGLPAG